METPDKWIILKIEHEGTTIYKVFASWYGGYLGSDSWKMNSGIVKIEDDGNYWKFYGYSGSCYQCIKGMYGTSMYSQGIINNIIQSAEKVDASVVILPENTNWLELVK